MVQVNYIFDVQVSREKLIKAVLRLVSSERDEAHMHYADELEYCHDMILEAAQELVKASEQNEERM